MTRLKGELSRISDRPITSAAHAMAMSRLQTWIGAAHMYEGDYVEASAWFAKGIASAEFPGVPSDLRANLRAARGVAALRRGETDNCVACLGPSSCIFPIAREAVHTAARRLARGGPQFTAYLRERPEDLGVRWLLNIAYMTLGEYPDKVRPEVPDPARSHSARSSTWAGSPTWRPRSASIAGGRTMAGGSIFDDFTGDGLPRHLHHLVRLGPGASLFVNRGDGTFEDRSEAAGPGRPVAGR